LQQDKDKGPYYRPQELLEASEHRHEDEVPRMRPVGKLRVSKTCIHAKNHTTYRAVHCRNQKRNTANLTRLYAEVIGLHLVVASGLQV